MLSAPQGALSMKSARTKIILDGEKFINTIKKNKKRIRLQALKRVGPPLKNQGSSSLDSLQALGYYKIMKVRSKHNNLLNYFIVDHKYLSKEYIKKSKKFLECLKKKPKK